MIGFWNMDVNSIASWAVPVLVTFGIALQQIASKRQDQIFGDIRKLFEKLGDVEAKIERLDERTAHLKGNHGD